MISPNRKSFYRLMSVSATPSLTGAFLIVVLTGCTAGRTPKSALTLPEPDYVAVSRLRESVVAESKKLLETHETLQAQIRKEFAPPDIKPVEPKFDPLEGKTVAIAMSMASVSQILLAIADSAKINLIVDPAVLKIGLVSDMYLRSVSLRDAFNEVLRVYDLSGEIKGNTLRVTLNEEKLISLDFLNATSSMDLSSGGNVFGSGSAGTNALRGNLSLTGAGGIKSDPYTEIENAIRIILGEGQGKTQSPVAPLYGGAPTNGQAADGSANGRQTPSFAASPGGVLAEGEKVESMFSINKMTGTVYVKARPSKVRSIEKMLTRVQGMLRKQVYIEAQLVDVQLSDGFEFGVDWTLLKGKLASSFGATPAALSSPTGLLGDVASLLPGRGLTIPAQSIGSPSGQSLGVGYLGGTLSTVVNALRSFGNLRVLSNPNIQVRNGTPAILSVGTNSRYVSRSMSSQTTPGGGASTTTSDVQTDSVFSGVMVGVLPFIRDDGRIELLVNPMQSDVDGNSLQLVSVNATNRISLPVVNYKALTTTLNLGDGDVVVIGGLIDQRTSGSDRGAPGVSDVPGIGWLFKKNTDTSSSRELVVVLRVRLL